MSLIMNANEDHQLTEETTANNNFLVVLQGEQYYVNLCLRHDINGKMNCLLLQNTIPPIMPSTMQVFQHTD